MEYQYLIVFLGLYFLFILGYLFRKELFNDVSMFFVIVFIGFLLLTLIDYEEDDYYPSKVTTAHFVKNDSGTIVPISFNDGVTEVTTLDSGYLEGNVRTTDLRGSTPVYSNSIEGELVDSSSNVYFKVVFDSITENSDAYILTLRRTEGFNLLVLVDNTNVAPNYYSTYGTASDTIKIYKAKDSTNFVFKIQVTYLGQAEVLHYNIPQSPSNALKTNSASYS